MRNRAPVRFVLSQGDVTAPLPVWGGAREFPTSAVSFAVSSRSVVGCPRSVLVTLHRRSVIIPARRREASGTLLEGLEADLERVIEGGLRRLSSAGVQPLEIAQRLQTAMEDARLVSTGAPYAPNRYQVILSDHDLEALAGVADDVADQLGQHLEQYAREQGWACGSGVTVKLVGGGDRPGRVEIEHEFDESAPGGRLAVRSGQEAERFLIGERAVIGREPDCEVCLAEPRVSRRHALIEWTYRGYRVRDLGSHNGTFVNGAQVDAAELSDGDLLEVGLVQLRFALGE